MDGDGKRRLLTEVPEHLKVRSPGSQSRTKLCPNCGASVTAIFEETRQEYIYVCLCGSRWRE